MIMKVQKYLWYGKEEFTDPQHSKLISFQRKKNKINNDEKFRSIETNQKITQMTVTIILKQLLELSAKCLGLDRDGAQ